jgi:hypothetical protein
MKISKILVSLAGKSAFSMEGVNENFQGLASSTD